MCCACACVCVSRAAGRRRRGFVLLDANNPPSGPTHRIKPSAVCAKQREARSRATPVDIYRPPQWTNGHRSVGGGWRARDWGASALTARRSTRNAGTTAHFPRAMPPDTAADRRTTRPADARPAGQLPLAPLPCPARAHPATQPTGSHVDAARGHMHAPCCDQHGHQHRRNHDPFQHDFNSPASAGTAAMALLSEWLARS